MFGFVIQIGAVVAERELKLRQAMDTMGLRVSVFWLTWIAWEVVLVFLSSLLIVIFGLMFQVSDFELILGPSEVNHDWVASFLVAREAPAGAVPPPRNEQRAFVSLSALTVPAPAPCTLHLSFFVLFG
jgi:hypothetical protein